jgi:TRAP-type C4-dicarboxylate transport system permease large subunit
VTCALMDGLPALLIFYPILLPISTAYGIHPIHFTILAIGAQGIGTIMPPIGLIFFVVCSVARIRPERVYKPMIPYLTILIGTLFIISFMPDFVLLVPRLVIPGFK